MTISISDQTEKRFRKRVRKEIGTGKGKMGQAADEAFKRWVEEKEQKEIAQRGIAMLGKFKMGKILYKHRSELYERD